MRLDSLGTPHWEHNYSVIGEAQEIARAFLCQLPWTVDAAVDTVGTMLPPMLMECLYRVYEAKCATQKAHDSVGPATAFRVLTKKGKFGISLDCFSDLKQCFERKHIVPDIKFTSGCLIKEETPLRYL